MVRKMSPVNTTGEEWLNHQERQAMANPSTGTTGSATLMPNHRSDPADFGGLESYLEQAAWSRLNQARGWFVTHMDPHNQEAVETAWEDALLAMAGKVRAERLQRAWEGTQAVMKRVLDSINSLQKDDVEKTA